MGSGKSTVGPLVARRLKWKFVDVDDVIESQSGTSIAQLFLDEGEDAFRDREHETIAALVPGDALVMALGGGAIERSDNRDLLFAAPETLLVHLEVALTTTLARCRGTELTRPVLADQANLARRYERRLPLYRTAHVSLSVDTLSPEEVADAILAAAGLGDGDNSGLH
jgi:shikimate kinase